MKTLYLVRHAKAMERREGVPDFDRTLIKRGEKDALQLADHLVELGAKPDLIFTSPAQRSMSTARIIARQFDYPAKRIRSRKAIYEAAASQLYDILRTVGEDCDRVLLVGHDPALTDLAGFLVPDFRRDIPTSGVVGMEFTHGRWKDLASGAGKMVLFHFPGADSGAAVSKPRVKLLERRLYEAATAVLREVDVVVTAKLNKPIRKNARRLARLFTARVIAREEKKAASEAKTSRKT